MGGKMAMVMQMMEMMGASSGWNAGKGSQKGRGGSQKGRGGSQKRTSGDDNGNSSPKCQLFQALQKKKGKGVSLEKDDIVFEVNEVEPEEAGKGKWQAGVTIEGETYVGALALTKKDAEHAAALEALKQLFPGKKVQQAVTHTQGTKRKANQINPVINADSSPKSMLLNGVMALLEPGANVKDEVTFDTEKTDGKYVTTVTIKLKDQSFTGKPSVNAKDAEHNACKVAYAEFKDEFETAMESRKAAKIAKKQEQREAFRAKIAAEKAAKEA